MNILNYYPVLFVLGFLVMIFVMYKDSVHQSSKNKKTKSHINSSNKLNWLMNNKQPVINETELVDALTTDEILYKGVEDCGR